MEEANERRESNSRKRHISVESVDDINGEKRKYKEMNALNPLIQESRGKSLGGGTGSDRNNKGSISEEKQCNIEFTAGIRGFGEENTHSFSHKMK